MTPASAVGPAAAPVDAARSTGAPSRPQGRSLFTLLSGPTLLLVASWASGSLGLFAIGFGLLLTYVGLFLAVRAAAARLVVVRRVDRHEVVEGHPITIEYELGGLGGLPIGVELLCRCGRWHALRQGVNTVTWTIDQPGLHAVTASPVRIRDDLGLFTRLAMTGADDEILVLPVPASPTAAQRLGSMEVAQDPEPDGLRPYVRGTPMSRIHWKSAAAGGELQERMFVPARDHLPLVIVDTAGRPSPDAVDWAARTAAGHVLALARGGGCRLLLPGDRHPTVLMDPVAHWPAVHRRLATLGRGEPSTNGVVDLAGAVRVSAAAAPAGAIVPRELLPPGVVAMGEWADA